MTLMMPSLCGSSAMSSGVISGFRRALVWADGGGGGGAATATATCPSVVSRCAPTRGDARHGDKSNLRRILSSITPGTEWTQGRPVGGGVEQT